MNHRNFSIAFILPKLLSSFAKATEDSLNFNLRRQAAEDNSGGERKKDRVQAPNPFFNVKNIVIENGQETPSPGEKALDC
ncbi:MAG: hypothetical protein A3B25_01465 [Candidatus Ryanbacteria bacterium RIFCSPLOWO2_01_FULL_48_26]|uniref:Uncharacterized protein n=1 Tax=Candidatus Ryanbacteria bacterium RIFCSPLOWO2_01_FULL_48_26 TaxID=1802126 RepID=A0A1G2GQU0_9BACT|nr:MAG: hypothetical protein A3B25_01465 [Candidatus Ryanbacteria bacterium RIFCSPLOWO2_01_FULL_48_26]